jgi:8-amino-7-oxononanoate synthase
MSLSERWSVALDELRRADRLRTLKVPSGIDFTSNDYLGYAGGRLPIHTKEDLPISGAASRLLRGNHPLWEEVEAALAAWHGAQSVLMMTSGYTANEGLLSTIIEPGDWVAGDELNHACIIDGLRLARPRKFAFRHNDLNHLEEGLRHESARRPPGRELFVITESLFSMDGDMPPLGAIVDLAERYGAYVIVDEAHATGCYGADGSGYVDELQLRERVLATMHTGGKALGVHGAYICGSQLLKDFLVNRCRHLIFTTAMPASVAATWLPAIERVRTDGDGRRRLRENAAMFRSAVNATVGSEFIVPIVLGDDGRAVAAATRMQEQGFDVRAIRPPSVPMGTSRLRISIHADHDHATLEQLASAVNSAVGQ